MWALPAADDLDSQVQLGWVCEGERTAAGAKLLQGVGEKILDDRVTDIKE